MLRSIKEIVDYKIKARDGLIGRIEDFLVSDKDWSIKYAVVNTGTWLNDRRVLIIPAAMEEPIWLRQNIPVTLSKEEVENAPPYNEHEPVSRVYERRLHSHYAWTPYFAAGVPGPSVVPVAPMPTENFIDEDTAEELKDNHLRSSSELLGYKIKTEDGEIGSISDFVIDDGDWTICYIVVDTGKWFSGKEVLISISRLKSVEWATQEASLGLKTETIRNAPEFDPDTPINKKEEILLYDFHGRPHIWE